MDANFSHDIAAICKNGHIVNEAMTTYPHLNTEYCKKCGEEVISRCPSCDEDISGVELETRPNDSWVGARGGGSSFEVGIIGTFTESPNHCEKCGEPYPWTENKIKAAIQIFAEFGDLDDKQKETIEQDITNLAKDSPGTELSAMRIKRIWESTPVAIAREGIMEFCSRTAAKILAS